MNIHMKGRFAGLEIGRIFAAVIVVMHHATSIASEKRFLGEKAFSNYPSYFYVGVDFFFVLSGFIIAWVHFNDIGNKKLIKIYFIKRFIRIFPPYWGILFPLIIMYLMIPSAGDPSKRDGINIITSIFLLPNITQPVLGVAWTLIHEVLFYIIFGLIIVGGRKYLWVLPLWATAIIAYNQMGSWKIIPQGIFPLDFIFSPFNLEFIFGVGAALLLRRFRVPFAKLFIVMGMVCFITAMLSGALIHDHTLLARIIFGTSTLIFVIGVVSYESNKQIAMPRVIWFLAAASYAVYLIHPVGLSFGAHVLVRILPTHFIMTSFAVNCSVLILLGVGVLSGVIYHQYIERFLTNVFHKILLPTKPSQIQKGAPQ